MRKLAAFAAVALLIGLSACANKIPAGAPPLSPREQAAQIDTILAGVQTAVVAALEDPHVASNATVKAEIKASSDAATAAVLAYHDQAGNCLRDPTTLQIGDAPGKSCDMGALATALSQAQTLLGSASELVTAFGHKPPAVTPPATSSSPG
jgi:hypothetical protein